MSDTPEKDLERLRGISLSIGDQLRALEEQKAPKKPRRRAVEKERPEEVAVGTQESVPSPLPSPIMGGGEIEHAPGPASAEAPADQTLAAFEASPEPPAESEWNEERLRAQFALIKAKNENMRSALEAGDLDGFLKARDVEITIPIPSALPIALHSVYEDLRTEVFAEQAKLNEEYKRKRAEAEGSRMQLTEERLRAAGDEVKKRFHERRQVIGRGDFKAYLDLPDPWEGFPAGGELPDQLRSTYWDIWNNLGELGREIEREAALKFGGELYIGGGILPRALKINRPSSPDEQIRQVEIGDYEDSGRKWKLLFKGNISLAEIADLHGRKISIEDFLEIKKAQAAVEAEKAAQPADQKSVEQRLGEAREKLLKAEGRIEEITKVQRFFGKHLRIASYKKLEAEHKLAEEEYRKFRADYVGASVQNFLQEKDKLLEGRLENYKHKSLGKYKKLAIGFGLMAGGAYLGPASLLGLGAIGGGGTLESYGLLGLAARGIQRKKIEHDVRGGKMNLGDLEYALAKLASRAMLNGESFRDLNADALYSLLKGERNRMIEAASRGKTPEQLKDFLEQELNVGDYNQKSTLDTSKAGRAVRKVTAGTLGTLAVAGALTPEFAEKRTETLDLLHKAGAKIEHHLREIPKPKPQEKTRPKGAKKFQIPHRRALPTPSVPENEPASPNIPAEPRKEAEAPKAPPAKIETPAQTEGDKLTAELKTIMGPQYDSFVENIVKLPPQNLEPVLDDTVWQFRRDYFGSLNQGNGEFAGRYRPLMDFLDADIKSNHLDDAYLQQVKIRDYLLETARAYKRAAATTPTF